MEWTVRDNPTDSRYDIVSGDEVGGFAAYRLRDGKITFTHTEVDSAYEGKGLGSTLVGGALDDARARELTVVARCPFVRSYIERHQEYADLLRS